MALCGLIWFVIVSALFQVKHVNPASEDIKKDSAVHLRMMRSDLERHFGVSSHDEVPEYEITHPFQVDEDGSFASHVLYPHIRQKRGLNEPNVWYYNIKAFGMSLHLNLSKNEELMAPGMTVEKHENGTITQEDVPKNTFYRGHVASQPGSLVALSNENGLTGMVRVLDQTLFLQPLDRQFVADDASEGRRAHVVYKRSMDHALTEHYLQHARQSQQLFEDPESTTPKRMRQTPKRKRRHDGKYLEMALVADKYTIAFRREGTKTFLLMLANLLNAIFQDETIGEKKITIAVVQLKLVTTGLDYHSQSSSNSKLSTLNKWASGPDANFPESDSNPLHADVIALFSRGTVGGYATFNSMCKSRSRFLFGDMGLASVLIMAHEAAHTLGVQHDGSKQCPNHQYIMSTVVPGGKNAMKWSECSRRTIETFLGDKSSACLDDKPKKSENYKKYFNSKLFPGVQVNGDEQCKLMYGEAYSQCKRTASNCGSLYCTSNGAGCVSRLAPPLDGTTCGVRHHCVKGECVDEGSEIIHGGWGKWGSYTKCSRTCGGGLQWRTRTCTKPRPQNGGDNCEGKIKGFPRICNIKPCPANGVSYRTHQCKRFGQHLIEYYKPNAPCALLCRWGNTYSPKGWVADGTNCYPNPTKKDICVGGKCLMVGCDNVIGSKASVDRCGKCNGDSTKCVEIKMTYTLQWQNVGVNQPGRMFTAPKGSRRIWVYNNAINSNYNAIGVRDAKNNYLIKLPSRTKTIQAAGSKIYYVKKKNEYVYIPGPINMSLKFVYVYLKSKPGFSNKGIKYQFLKPGKAAISSDEVEWKIQSNWTKCTEACAGGKKTRLVRCRRKDDKTIVSDNICGNGPNRPLSEMECNTQPCPKQWHLTDWTSCSKTCGPGFRTRELSCREKVANPGTYNVVSGCKEPKPTMLKKICIKAVCPVEWVASEWSQCSKTCGGEGLATRNLTCKRLGTSGQFTVVPSTLCRGAVKPPTSQECNEDLPCTGKESSYYVYSP